MTTCVNCSADLVPEFDTTDYQYDNCLWLGFFGGYGMFIESRAFIDEDQKAKVLADTGASIEAVLCHECAHELCEKLPWLGKLLEPQRSHAHTLSYWEVNPDHEGWDKK